MDSGSKKVFLILFKEALEKCFGHHQAQPLTETESKLLYSQVFATTGLVIGWKSLKNYSFFVLDENSSKEENPSIATLDTLARYVLNAPYITETERKTHESHFPYWFQYKEKYFLAGEKTTGKSIIHKKKPYTGFMLPVLVVLILVCIYFIKPRQSKSFTENFHSLDEDSLIDHGWVVKDKDTQFWNKRNEEPNTLLLFTLTGDNWPDSAHQPGIKNLLFRKINSACFTAELHLQDFFPKAEWQQAGILLMEDTSYSSKSLRLSIAYNDFFGGYAKPKEVIIQAITSSGNGLSQPEEIVHLPVFTLDPDNESLVKNNLAYSALRIEKSGNRFRLLYSCTPNKNFAFKEAAVSDFNFQPKYIGIFALQGFVNTKNYLPVKFTSFALAPQACK